MHNDLFPDNYRNDPGLPGLPDYPLYNSFTEEDYIDYYYYYDYTANYDDFSKHYDHPDDPHNCQNSCSSPGPDCISCTNKDYFQCPLSGLCLHPDLRCDGHTQCPFAEDESLDVCFERWVGAKFVSPFASLKCSSVRYPGTNIYSIPCDGIVECADGRDERSCRENSYVN